MLTLFYPLKTFQVKNKSRKKKKSRRVGEVARRQNDKFASLPGLNTAIRKKKNLIKLRLLIVLLSIVQLQQPQ